MNGLPFLYSLEYSIGPGVTMPPAGQYSLRQVLAGLDEQGQPRELVYVHSFFSTSDLYN